MPAHFDRLPWKTPVERTAQLDLDTRDERGGAENSLEVRREQAIGRVKAHKIHRFHVILGLYLIVNALLIVNWALCAVIGWSAYFPWYLPILTIVMWGLLVVRVRSRAYEVNTYPEEQVQREMQKRH